MLDFISLSFYSAYMLKNVNAWDVWTLSLNVLLSAWITSVMFDVAALGTGLG